MLQSKFTSFFQRSDLTRTLWSFRREFLAVGVFSMFTNVLMLTPTIYMLQVYDRVLVSQSELTLLAMSVLTLLLYVVMAFAEWMRSRLLVGTGVRLDEQLSTKVFNASFESNLNQSSTRANRAFSDLINIRQFLTGNGIFALFDAPWAPVYMGVLFFLHPLLGVVGIFFAIVQAAVAWLGHRGSLAPMEATANAASQASGFLQAKLRNAEVLESMGMVSQLQKRWADLHARYMQLHVQAHDQGHRISAWSKWVRYSQQSLALGAGALLVIDGQLSPGGMIAANVLMSRALAPVDLMVGSWRQFLGMRQAFLRVEKLLNDFPERDPALKRVAPRAALRLAQVVASAEGRTVPILKGISLQVDAGAVVAVLGPSGSGKSTLARVLVGIWPDVQGEVLMDEMPIAGWNRMELGPHIGYLPQDIELFDGSIAENICRFGEVVPEKVIAAAKAAGLHEMILRFPKGYDSPIGEAGGVLSGGQRQRVALARAVYGDPQLLVLDEPNANLDDAGEAALLNAVHQLKAKGRTVVLVTHRPGAVAVADRIVILQEGEIQMDGPREAVIAKIREHQNALAAQVAQQTAGATA